MQQQTLIPPRTIQPPPYAAHLAGQTLSVTIPRQVRLRLKSPQKVKVSEWALAHRRVPEGAHEGPWRHELAPHTVKIMDTYGLPWVREVWFCGVEQSGKTNTMINCMGWAIDCDPGNIFYLMPTEASSNQIFGQKVKPTLQRSPTLAKYLGSKQDDTTLSRITLKHGVTIFPAHANSPTSMATFAAKHCFGDEVDKYPAMVGKEADPITLLKKRNRNYRGRFKRMFASTPASGFIYKGLKACHQIWEYRVRCFECGEYLRMDADHLVIPEEATPENVDRLGVEYACVCGSLWDDADRETAIRAGRWYCIQGEDLARPAKVGYHHRAWECLDVPLVEIAAAWMRAKHGDLSAKTAWSNGYEAIDYKHETKERKENTILRLCDERHTGDVHPESDILTIQIDTQDKGFWYTIRGWQYGPQLNSWLVKAGYVPSANADDFSALDQLIYDDVYTTAAGVEHRIAYGIIDTAGHRTGEVYAWCRRTGIFASKGARGRKTQPVTVSKMEVFPGTTRQIPGGLLLYHLDTHYHKDLLNNKLQVEATDPGAFVLHSGYSIMQRALLDKTPELPLANSLLPYAKHFCAEYRDEKGLWQCSENAENHLWDCESMGIALAYYLGFHKKRREEKQPETHPAAGNPGGGTPTKPNWFNRRRAG